MNMFGGEPNTCPRCEKRVYFAEQVIALGSHWHKPCFSCANPDCRRRLDSRSAADHAGEAYCVNCHRRMFGPKGYGSTLSMETPVNNDVNQKAVGNMASAHARGSMVAPLADRGNQYTSIDCGKASPDTSVGSADLDHIVELLSREKPWNMNDKNLCRRCGKTVYFAEKQLAGGATWHRQKCFTCVLCNKGLQPGQLCEKEGEIMCKGCYGKAFGPKGYGFGVGSGTLNMAQ